MWQIYINIRTKTFIQVIRPWAYLYKCGRSGLTILDRMMAEFTETIWTSAQGLWGQKSKSKPVRYRKGSQDRYWGQLDLATNIFDLKLGPKLKSLRTGAPTTRGQDWVSPTMETLATGECHVNILLTNLLFPCLILSRPAGQPKAPPSLGGKGGVRQSGASSCHPEVIQ